MATFTEHYNLMKPGEEDYYDVLDFNENMDTIDGMMAQMETAAEGISEKIGTPVGSETVFSLLHEKKEDSLYYVPSVAVQKNYHDVVVWDNAEYDTEGIFKIADFTAKHDGTVRIYMKTTAYGRLNKCIYFSIYNMAAAEIALAPDCSIVENATENRAKPAPIYKELIKPFDSSAADNTADTEFCLHLPVEKGKAYIFIIDYSSTRILKINDFQISYDEVQDLT
ncbi:MAG: hypothetical protein IKI88_08100 [Anaerotignum sp.]|nr:hypothetical protein [Anaerotignum sp.]